jgi:hypothetical protein
MGGGTIDPRENGKGEWKCKNNSLGSSSDGKNDWLEKVIEER